jgi:hypothetical protein
MNEKCKQLSVALSTTPVDTKESDRALFAFFDSIFNEKPGETKSESDKTKEIINQKQI